MIEVYTRNIDGVWFGTACAEQRVFGTAFANSQKEVLKTLLSSIPFNVPFRVFSEPSAFAETVLSSAKNVYDGNDVSQKLPLATGHLSAYTQRVLEVVSKIPIG